MLFQPDDILIFRAEKTSSLQKDILGSNDAPEAAVEEANVFFLYRCCDKNSELYMGDVIKQEKYFCVKNIQK